MVLVILAATGGIPMATSTGNEINVPPPAIALTNPAASGCNESKYQVVYIH